MTTATPELRKATAEHIAIATEIRRQINVGDHWRSARWGSRNWAVINEGDHGKDIGYVRAGLAFKVSGTNNVKKGGHVAIYLLGNDTYMVRVLRVHGSKINEVALVREVYCDTLGTIIDDILDG